MNPGQQISRYLIRRSLGQGGMGVVYLAEDTRLQRPVALKFLASDSLSESDKVRFLNEARAAAAIRHPNICPIHDIEEADGRLFISMAYIEGETLARRLHRGPLPIDLAAHIALQVARGLDQAHSQGIVHRDIKPGNILLAADGHVSILDFGLALLPGAERVTQAGSAVGTPSYMSPEQCEGRETGPRTDIWSLGVVLFEMLAGSLPFQRANATATALAILRDHAPALSSLRPATPAPLGQAVEKALAKDPEKRWSSAREFEAALAPYAGSTLPLSSADATATVALPVTAAAPAKPKRLSRLFLFAALAVLLALAGLLYWRNSASGPSARPGERLVAILPLQILGSSPETAEIANGLTEILTAALSDFERADHSIAAIPSSEIRRRNINSAADARRIYGASLVVSGAAQPLGAKVQLSLALIDPSASRQLSARVFEYDPAESVASRRRAVSELAALLSLNNEAVQRTAVGGETTAPAAFNAYLKGRGYLARFDVAGNLDRAIADFRQAVAADPNYALAHAALGEALWRRSRTSGDVASAARAVEHAELAVRLNPALPTLRTSLAAIYTMGGRPDDAISELKEALKSAPDSAEAHRELARVYQSQGRFPEAEASFRRAIEARPTDWYGYLLLGLLYQEMLEFDKAIAAFRHARELTPDNELIYRNLGVAYLNKGDYAQALAELQQSLKLKPNAGTYATLGATYFRLHRYPDAVAALDTALDLDSSRYYFWGNLGIYCKWDPGSGGRSRPALEKAVDLARKRLEITPTDYDVRADLGEYYARLGNKAGALAEIEHIPESARPNRLDRIAIVYELTGNRAKAIPLLAGMANQPGALQDLRSSPDLAALFADPALPRQLRP
ncbi:MAG: protein kinase [Acidobacteria bacterium]|nr:protein kinase [Acidobacteriota bacterium]